MHGRKYATIQSECERLGVSYRYMRSLIARRVIPALKLGPKTIRLIPDEVDQALEAFRCEGHLPT